MIKSIFQIASLTLLTLVSIILPAQELTHTDHCGTVLYNRQLETDHPEIGKAREAFHRQLDAYLASMPHEKRSPKEVITIPVVVHVVWNTAEQNIPDEQVWSQFFVLNEDFRRLNPDTIHTPAMFKPVAADCGIEFCMARRTPDSLPASGIVRVHTDTVQFPMDNTVKSAYAGGSKAWDAKRYLNIWVCHMAGNILGYAQMPGGPDSTDGVVIDYRVFGKVGTLNPHYNLGRTTTHEIGHWLDLYHIWGDDGGSCDGTDYVDDTPNAADANYYCPSQPHLSACNDTGEMFMNYMDYVDDPCFNIFTYGQRDRMLATINTYRPQLLTSKGCDPSTGIAEILHPLQITLYPNPAGNIVRADILLPRAEVLKISILNLLGQEVLSQTSPQRLSVHQLPLDLSTLPNGVYLVRVSAGGFSGSEKLIVNH